MKFMEKAIFCYKVNTTQGGVMKIFIPMANADLPLDDEITGKLVPFDPSFLKSQTAKSDGFKPRNWVSEFTREQAQNRLMANQG